MTVFVSDRYPPVRERLVSMISAIAGIEIIGRTEDAGDMPESVQRLGPDMVVMDVRPGVMELLAKLQQIRQGKNVPVFIVLADSPSFSYREKLCNGGADFVFHRSNGFQNLLSLMNEMARRRS